MKIVLDSNVLIAAFATHGICHLLVEACLLDHYVHLSDFILGEVGEKLERKIKLPKKIVEEITTYLKEHAEHHNPAPSQEPVSRDPDDDNVLRLAEETDAEYIVTGDKDLLVLNSHIRTKIVSPREFTEILRGQQGRTSDYKFISYAKLTQSCIEYGSIIGKETENFE